MIGIFAWCSNLLLRAVCIAACDDNSLGPAAKHCLDEALFVLDRIIGVSEQELDAAGLEHFRDSAGRIRETPVVDRRDQRRDESRAPRHETLCRQIEYISDFLDGFYDTLTGLWRNRCTVAKCPRYRHGGNPGAPRHVQHGWADGLLALPSADMS